MGRLTVMLAVIWAVIGTPEVAVGDENRDYKAMRDRLVNEIKHDIYRTRHYIGVDELDPAVLQAIGKVERHEFVPDELRDEAYANHPLPIGSGQTISQPYIVALMTQLLEVDGSARVLEVGTGSGYQAAVLGEIVDEVYTIEIVETLAERAEANLSRLGYDNVHVRHGDGMLGWPEHAPFDGIIVTAAGLEIPRTLIDQLATGGRMVMPVGGQLETQQLMVVTKNEDGSVTERATIPVRFVPITGDHAGN